MKFEYDGYETCYLAIPAHTFKGRNDMKRFDAYTRRIPRSRMDRDLKEVAVVATKVKFYMKKDTLVFNADAFQLAEGSMLDALIRQLPGAELKDDGRILVNGRQVESLLLMVRISLKVTIASCLTIFLHTWLRMCKSMKSKAI